MIKQEYDYEPVRGLPERLPAGETMLWQGAPAWKSIALRAMHIRGTAIYFAVLLAWYLESKVTSGIPVSDFGPSFLKLAGAAALTLVLMAVSSSAAASRFRRCSTFHSPRSNRRT
jgi:hypothetical protein